MSLSHAILVARGHGTWVLLRILLLAAWVFPWAAVGQEAEMTPASNGVRSLVIPLPETIRQPQVVLPGGKAPERWPPVFSPASNDVLTLRGAFSDMRLGDSVAVFRAGRLDSNVVSRWGPRV